jgi:hypothetical protein
MSDVANLGSTRTPRTQDASNGEMGGATVTTYDNWKATDRAAEQLDSDPADELDELLDHLDQLTQKASCGADWAEICRLESSLIELKGGFENA